MAEKTTTGRLIAAGGGILLIISLFLSWYGVNFSGALGQYATGIDASANGWQSLDIGDLVFFIVGLLALLPAALDIFDLEIELPFDVGLVALGGGGLSVLWIILRIIDKPGPDIPSAVSSSVSVGLKFGIFIALIGAALIVFGGFRQTQEEDTAIPFVDPVSGQPQAAPAAAAPGVPPQAPPPAQAPPAPQAPPPGQQPPAPPAPPAV